MKKSWIAIVAILFSVQGHATGNHLNNKPKNETNTVELTKKSIEKYKKATKKATKPRSSPSAPVESNEAPLDRIMAQAAPSSFFALSR